MDMSAEATPQAIWTRSTEQGRSMSNSAERPRSTREARMAFLVALTMATESRNGGSPEALEPEKTHDALYSTSTSWTTADTEGRVYTHIRRAVELVL